MSIRFIDSIDVESTMIFEREYPDELKLDLDEKEELLDRMHYKVWLATQQTKGIELIGETYGATVAHLLSHDDKIPGIEDLPEYNTFYVYSNTIVKDYQKMGYGKILKAYLLGLLWQHKEIQYVTGHSNANGSIQINEFFGAQNDQCF